MEFTETHSGNDVINKSVKHTATKTSYINGWSSLKHTETKTSYINGWSSVKYRDKDVIHLWMEFSETHRCKAVIN